MSYRRRMAPAELASELGVAGSVLRAWLRRTYSRSVVDHGSRWVLTPDQVKAARQHFAGVAPVVAGGARREEQPTRTGGRAASDEAYVIDLCDEVLDERALRQHRFEWLLGDLGRGGRRAALPVDAYYPGHRLVVEYRERQHDEAVPHFDKPDRVTVSGVDRGAQRRIYDRRREDEIPTHGLRLLVISAGDLDASSSGRLRRHREADLTTLRSMLR